MGRKPKTYKLNQKNPVKSWDNVDLTLKTMCELTFKIEETNTEYKRQARELRMNSLSGIKPLKQEYAEHENNVKAFVSLHREEIEGKAKHLNFGKTGFRQSTNVVIPQGAEKKKEILNTLKAKKMKGAIIVDEKISREGLKRLNDKTLTELGVEVKKKDDFFLDFYKENVRYDGVK